MEGERYEVVGVLPPDFHLIHVLNRELDVFVPLVIQAASANRDDHSINVYARLKANVTLEAAQSEMTAIAQKLASDYPQTNSGRGVSLVRLQENFAERVRPTLLLLLAAVGFVVLIACSNIANLLLARSIHRQKELAI